MKISTIASGSSGNCIYISGNNTNIIIDAGISKKRIEEGLNVFDTSLSDIDAILITHEHSDHINGLGVVSRKYNIPMYATQETIDEIKEMKNLGQIDSELFISILPDKEFKINELGIRPFRISHDAANPVAYRVKCEKHAVAVATDLGVYTDYTISNLSGLDALVLEANHDVNMLEVGCYPYYIKQRILSDKGHLSNENSGRLLSSILHDGFKHAILGHISRENNYSQLAYETVRTEITISDNEYRADDFPIVTAEYGMPSELIEI